MSDPFSTSYDEIPYDSTPRRVTHPDCLGTLATLLGMDAAPIERCRVLELGCATGGNLIPQAATLPDSQFVGIDLSTKQIAQARELAESLGLSNIELKAASILDVDESYGRFDYIVCHGVYSWVPAPVQDKILSVCKNNLAPQGVAYVSYNAYPGWHFRGPVRDMMKFHVRQFQDSRTRVQQARAFFKFLVSAIPDQKSPYARLLAQEAEILDGNADFYLFHEHLEDENHPLYFVEFMERAAAQGLQYLGESRQHMSMADLPAEVGKTFKELATDLLHLEQYHDFLRNRSFRRTLLVHDDVSLNRAPSPDIVARFRISALAMPVANPLDIRSERVEHFETPEKRTCATGFPLIKAMLAALSHAWPRVMTLTELAGAVVEELGSMTAEEVRPRLAKAIMEFYLNDLVDLHLHVPPFVTQVSDRPLAYPLARRQAANGAMIATLRHTVAELNGLDRLVLSRLDGTQDRQQLLEALVKQVTDKGMVLQKDGQSISSGHQVREILQSELPLILCKLAANCLLLH
jgi:methyltransferase-like protein/cyclopropane fatty-acyl-phospholipid synthase-like methyltransferase